MSSTQLLHGALTEQIIGGLYQVADELGCGFLESVYEMALAMVLEDLGLHVQRQARARVFFRGVLIGTFTIDLLVEHVVAVELKAARNIDPAHEAQLLNFLRASKLEVGLILNFGSKPAFRRLVYSNDRKLPPAGPAPDPPPPNP